MPELLFGQVDGGARSKVGASYAERYRILCTRLMERRLYTAAALVLTPQGGASQRALSPETSLHSFFRQLAGYLAARA
jgi:hypothetical protein